MLDLFVFRHLFMIEIFFVFTAVSLYLGKQEETRASGNHL